MFFNKFNKKGSLFSLRQLNSKMFYRNNLMLKYFSVIGLDMGGTNTCIAVMEPSGPRVIENAEGLRTTPSVVSINEEGEEFVASAAKRNYIINLNRSFYGTKYFFGRKFSDPFVQQFLKRFPFKIEKGPDDEVYFLSDQNKCFTAKSVSVMYLKYVKEQAVNLTGKPVKKLVMCLPSYINEEGQKELKDTMKECGMDVVKFVNESKSAALAYNLHLKENVKKFIVFNFGGLNSSISYLEKKENAEKEAPTSSENAEEIEEDIFEIKNEFFDYFLGGEDIDSVLIKFLFNEFERVNKMDISKDLYALQRVRDAAEQAKIELSNSQQAEINLPFLTSTETGPKHLNMRLSKSKFETLIDPITTKLKKNCEEFLKINKINTKEIDDIILVGGISRVNRVQDVIKQVFGRDLNTSLNPEEAPAVGASILASQIKLKVEEIQTMDKLPLSLGIETLAGEFTRIINKDTLLPIKITKIFTSVTDNQPKMDMKIYFGERELASENKLLGNFSVILPLLKKGEPRIQVSFNVNNKGDLSITAQDELSKKITTYSTKINTGLTQEIVEEFLEVSEKLKESDKAKKDLMDLRVEADNYIYGLEKIIKEEIDRVEKVEHKEELEKIDSDIKNLHELLKTENFEEIITSFQTLQKDYERIENLLKN